MAWVADILGKTIMVDGTPVPDRKLLNFKPAASVLVEDNPATESTDVTISGTATTGVDDATGTATLTALDSGKTLVNTGGAVTWNLPAAASGLGFELINMHAGGATLRANGSDVIEFGSAASSAGGTQSTTDLYASVRIRAVGSKWIAVGQPAGSWAAA
jgi:hypothetical protein